MRELRVDDSSNVRRLAWRPGNTLEVEFSSGSTYLYANVQLHQLAEAAGASSVGSWVQKTLVKNPKAYPCTKVRAPDDDQEKRLADQLAATRMRAALVEIADWRGDPETSPGDFFDFVRAAARRGLGREP